MIKSTSTAHLIENMNHSEKRHFMLLNQHAQPNKNYLQLFRILDKNPNADNDTITKKLGKSVSNLSQEKIYLQWQLLKSLRQFHEDQSYQIQLQNILSEIEVLFNKRLFDLCAKKIKQYKTIAREGDFFSHLMQFIEWEQRCSMASSDMDYIKSRQKKVFAEEEMVLHNLQELMEIKKEKTYLLSFLFPMGYLRNKDISIFRAAVKKSEKRKLLSITSTRAKLQQLEMMFLGYQYLFDIPSAMKYCRQELELFHTQTHLIPYHLSAYCACMANFISGSFQLGHLDEALQAIEKYEQIAFLKGVKPSQHLIIEMQLNSTLYKLMIYSAQEEYKKGWAVVESSRKYFMPLTKHKRKDGLVVFFFFAAHHALFNNQPNVCIENLDIIFKEFKEAERSDYVTCAHVMELMAHYDSKNWRTVPYKAQSVKRFLQTRKINLQAPYLIVKCFETLEKHDLKKHKKLFQNLLQELEKLDNENNDESYFIHTLMIKEWLRMK